MSASYGDGTSPWSKRTVQDRHVVQELSVRRIPKQIVLTITSRGLVEVDLHNLSQPTDGLVIRGALESALEYLKDNQASQMIWVVRTRKPADDAAAAE